MSYIDLTKCRNNSGTLSKLLWLGKSHLHETGTVLKNQTKRVMDGDSLEQLGKPEASIRTPRQFQIHQPPDSAALVGPKDLQIPAQLHWIQCVMDGRCEDSSQTFPQQILIHRCKMHFCPQGTRLAGGRPVSCDFQQRVVRTVNEQTQQRQLGGFLSPSSSRTMEEWEFPSYSIFFWEADWCSSKEPGFWSWREGV